MYRKKKSLELHTVVLLINECFRLFRTLLQFNNGFLRDCNVVLKIAKVDQEIT